MGTCIIFLCQPPAWSKTGGLGNIPWNACAALKTWGTQNSPRVWNATHNVPRVSRGTPNLPGCEGLPTYTNSPGLEDQTKRPPGFEDCTKCSPGFEGQRRITGMRRMVLRKIPKNGMQARRGYETVQNGEQGPRPVLVQSFPLSHNASCLGRFIQDAPSLGGCTPFRLPCHPM